MPFQFELCTDRPALVNHYGSHLDPGDIMAMAEELSGWLARLDHRVYYINNVGSTRLSLGDIMEGAQLAGRGAMPLLHHPKIIESLVVTTDAAVSMAARSINSSIFGYLKLKIFTTLDQALAYIDESASGKSLSA